MQSGCRGHAHCCTLAHLTPGPQVFIYQYMKFQAIKLQAKVAAAQVPSSNGALGRDDEEGVGGRGGFHGERCEQLVGVPVMGDGGGE